MNTVSVTAWMSRARFAWYEDDDAGVRDVPRMIPRDEWDEGVYEENDVEFQGGVRHRGGYSPESVVRRVVRARKRAARGGGLDG